MVRPISYLDRIAMRYIPVANTILASIALILITPLSFKYHLNEHLGLAAFIQVFWSIITVFLVYLMFKFPTVQNRTLTWLFGFVGYWLAVSIFFVSALIDSGTSSVSPVGIRELMVLGLEGIGWVLGVGWTLRVLALSVREGDWKSTIWAKMFKKKLVK